MCLMKVVWEREKIREKRKGKRRGGIMSVEGKRGER